MKEIIIKQAGNYKDVVIGRKVILFGVIRHIVGIESGGIVFACLILRI